MAIKFLNDINLGLNDIYAAKYWMYDGPNDNYGSMHFTDGNFHIEDADGHPLFVVEDGFLQIHKSPTIQSNLYTTDLTATRDHYLPNASGTIALTSQIPSVSGTTNYVSKFTGSTSLGNSQIFDNGTNVGIGTTSPSEKLHVVGSGLFQSTAYTNAIFDGTNSTDWGNNIAFRSQGTNFGFIGSIGSLLGSTEKDMTIWATSGNGFRIYTNASERMRITSAGNVGIGTTSPGSKLTVAGEITSTYGSNQGRLNLGDIAIQEGSFTSYGVLDYTLHNGGGYSQIMRIQGNGNVGIGTSSPSYKTTIASNPRNTDVLCVVSDQIDGDGAQSYVGISLQDQYANGGGNVSAIRSYSNLYAQWGSKLTFSTTGNTGNGVLERMRINELGNVGIGTTSPTQELEVNGTILSTDGSFGTLALGAISTRIEGNAATREMKFYTFNSEKMIIDGLGNVGIGTSSPVVKLDVNGRTLVNEFQYTRALNISSENLNDYTLAGFYNGESMTNAPNSGWFWVTVERYSGNDAWAHQTATSFGSNNVANEVYTRTKTGGTWTNWKRLIDWTDINGTTNYVSKFTGNNSLGNSLLYDNGTNVGIGTSSPSSKLDVIGNVKAQGFYTPGFVIPAAAVGVLNNNNYGGPGWDNASFVTGNGATGVMMGGDPASYTYGWISGVQMDNGAIKNLVLQPLGGSVGVGTTTPNNSAALDVSSTTQGFLPPRMGTSERDAISGAVDGLLIWNTDNRQIEVYAFGAWLGLAYA
jgi:hypothetical protein